VVCSPIRIICATLLTLFKKRKKKKKRKEKVLDIVYTAPTHRRQSCAPARVCVCWGGGAAALHSVDDVFQALAIVFVPCCTLRYASAVCSAFRINRQIKKILAIRSLEEEEEEEEEEGASRQCEVVISMC